MESVIRKVTVEDCEDLAMILVHAYPGPDGITEESIREYALNLRNQLQEAPDNHFYGVYREGKLLGAFKMTEFTMNLRMVKVRVGGIAAVCYQNFAQTRTGMFDRRETGFNGMFHYGHTIVGVRELSEITGYLSFRSQSDQISQIIITSQDDDFHYLLSDPTNGRVDSFETKALESSVTAVGAMYRVLHVKLLFAELSGGRFGPENCKLKITVKDRFFGANESSTIVRFNSGEAAVDDDDESFDAEIIMGIDNFSSLLRDDRSIIRY